MPIVGIVVLLALGAAVLSVALHAFWAVALVVLLGSLAGVAVQRGQARWNRW